MGKTGRLPRFAIFQHTVSQHREALHRRLSELRAISPLAPFSRQGEMGTWQGIPIACFAGGNEETGLVPILEQSTVEYVFVLGLAGSLSPVLGKGDLVSPIASVRGDGLTDYWADARLPAVADATALLAVNQSARRLGFRVANGVFYTTSTMYREMDFAGKWAELGVVGIQMELAQYFVLSYLHRKRAAGVYVISDLPLEGDRIWRTGFSADQGLLDAYERSVDVLLGAIQLLAGEEFA